MDDAKPSLAKRALAVLVLAVVAVVAFRMLLGALSAILWIVVIVAAIIAGLWAMSTLRSATRTRGEKRARTVKPASAEPLPAAPPRGGVDAARGGVDAELRRVKEELRDQGRL